jgi:hypothetical protein
MGKGDCISFSTTTKKVAKNIPFLSRTLTQKNDQTAAKQASAAAVFRRWIAAQNNSG